MSNNKGWEKVNYAVHPGEILKEYLEDANMTQKELSEKPVFIRLSLMKLLTENVQFPSQMHLNLKKYLTLKLGFGLIYNQFMMKLTKDWKWKKRIK